MARKKADDGGDGGDSTGKDRFMAMIGRKGKRKKGGRKKKSRG